MGTEGIQLIVMLIMLICSSYFSATETAFSSLNKTRVKTLAEKGNKKAERVLNLSEKYDKLLSTILIGNNIVNIVLSSLCTVFCINLVKGNQSVGTVLSTVASTVVVLIFGEITPKSLAKENPEKFAMFSAPIIKFLMVMLTPLSILFGGIKWLLSKVIKSSDDRRMTQDELLTLVEEVEQEGGIDSDESELLRSAIEFTDREASDILTPRTALEAVEENLDNDDISRVFRESGYSRLPVYSGSIDSIVGIIHQKDFYSLVNGTGTGIDFIMKKPVYIPLSMKISDILKLLQKNKSHIAIVVDEYGGLAGIVSMEDLLESIVGSIQDEYDHEEEEVKQTGDNTFEVDGAMAIDEVGELLGTAFPEGDYDTVAGFMIDQLGRIPTEEEHASVTFENVEFTVLKMDERRIELIHIIKHETIAEE